MKVDPIEEGIYKVSSERDSKKFYEVIIDPRTATCTCPHFKFRCERQGLACKHIIAVKEFQEVN